MPRKIKGLLGRVLIYFTLSSCVFPIGHWTRVVEIIPVLGAFLGAVPAVLMALFLGGLEGVILVALFLFSM